MNPGRLSYPAQLWAAALFTIAAAARATYFDLDRIVLQSSDEVGYIKAGLSAMQDQWNVYSFPLHSLTYALTGVFEADPVRNFQINGFIPFFLVVFLLQALVIKYTRSPLLAVLSCVPLLLSTEIGILAWPHANQTACMVILAGLLFLPDRPGLDRVAVHFTVLGFAAAFARSELALALYAVFAVVLAYVAARCARYPREWVSRLFGTVLPVAAVTVGLSMAMAQPVLLDRYRSWAAFTQHFSYSLSLRTNMDEDPWIQDAEVAGRYFGEARSISHAIVENPAAVFEHVWHNFRMLVSWVFSPDTVAATGWVVVIALYAIVAARTGWACIAAMRHARVPVPRLRKVLTLVFPAPVLLMVVLIFPRPNYLQFAYVLGAACLVAGWDSRLGKRIENRFLKSLSSCTTSAALVAGALVLGLMQPIPRQADPVRAAVEAVRASMTSSQAVEEWEMLSTNGGHTCVFIHRNCQEVALQGMSGERFVQRLSDRRTAFLLVGSEQLRFVPDETRQLLAAIGRDPAAQGWQPVRGLPGTWSLYRRTETVAAYPE